MTPPITPPSIGATQNNHRALSARAPPKIAVAVDRAGLREAFDIGIATRWNMVSARPIAIGANPAGARGDVAPTMTTRNKAVITVSVSKTAAMEKPPPPYRLEIMVNVFHLAGGAPLRIR